LGEFLAQQMFISLAKIKRLEWFSYMFHDDDDDDDGDVVKSIRITQRGLLKRVVSGRDEGSGLKKPGDGHLFSCFVRFILNFKGGGGMQPLFSSYL
jgi:hypothetical protein